MTMQVNTIDLSNPLVDKARIFALAAHSGDRSHGPTGQKRKYSDEPYIVHPMHVCAILQTISPISTVPVTVEMMMAALLHDVVEDTGITIGLIEQEFGAEVARLVSGLTDVSRPEDGNRKFRKDLDLKHTAEQEADVKTVKLADMISNAGSIIEHDPGFAIRWMQEKANLLEVLTEGDATLYAEATKILQKWRSR